MIALFKISMVALACCCFSSSAIANHVKGGYIQYEYKGPGTDNTSLYAVTITIFYACNVQGPQTPITLKALDASSGTSVNSVTLLPVSSTSIRKNTFNPCMSNPPSICYEVNTYSITVTLANNNAGYILAATDQFRTNGIVNINSSGATGITFTAQIPGIIQGSDYHTNSSPVFDFKDTAIVCYRGNFTYQFSANDPIDHDSITYSFGNGLSSNSINAPPFFSPLDYASGYSGMLPMGASVNINATTGLISGRAPTTAGEYVIAVYATEWRNGVVIDSIKKELQVYVADCSLTEASLPASYLNCNNYTFTFVNQSAATNITTYSWDFGVLTTTTDVSTQPTPTYVYGDTGTYIVKLRVGNTAGCEDSTTSLVKVYPGFNADFTILGGCYQSPFVFRDSTYSKNGLITSYTWDFGDAATNADTSTLKNPMYQYATVGSVTATLVVVNDKGCTDTATKMVVITNKPQVTLPFNDTLICSGDSLPLKAFTTGTSYSWTPLYNIINQNSLNPVFYPKDTTKYTLVVHENGCVDSASIVVNVLDFITVKLSPDTGICKGDSLILRPNSYALKYQWSELPGSNSLDNYNTKNPVAVPSVNTTYYVIANLGKCQDKAQINVFVSPFPVAKVGDDTSICAGTIAYLNGMTNAPNFSWSPSANMADPATLHPRVAPGTTTTYIFRVKDTSYCTKAVSDTITVKVIHPLPVNAGNDTAITIGEPLQLQVLNDNSSYYQWTPSTGLNNPSTYNPVATINTSSIDSIVYKVTVISQEGCSSSDHIMVKIFKTAPDIFVPTAFTPNSDGQNDLLRPILVGISKLKYFRVYNRWGQLVYSTTAPGQGWDGKILGAVQPTGTFACFTQGVDYKGNTITRKGTVVLIR
jgi:gliding motility-associated-like protein